MNAAPVTFHGDSAPHLRTALVASRGDAPLASCLGGGVPLRPGPVWILQNHVAQPAAACLFFLKGSYSEVSLPVCRCCTRPGCDEERSSGCLYRNMKLINKLVGSKVCLCLCSVTCTLVCVKELHRSGSGPCAGHGSSAGTLRSWFKKRSSLKF